MKFNKATLSVGTFFFLNEPLSVSDNGDTIRVFNANSAVVCEIEKPSVKIHGNHIEVNGFTEVNHIVGRVRFYGSEIVLNR